MTRLQMFFGWIFLLMEMFLPNLKTKKLCVIEVLLEEFGIDGKKIDVLLKLETVFPLISAS